MFVAASLLVTVWAGSSLTTALIIEPNIQVCVAAYIEGSLLRMPEGKGFDASAEFASRLEQLYLKRGGKPPAAPPGFPPRKFNGEAGLNTQCRGNEPKIMIHYRPLPNGQPYRMSYKITVGNRTASGKIDQDLSKRPGLGDGVLDAPWAPTSSIIDLEMTDHARQLLTYLGL